MELYKEILKVDSQKDFVKFIKLLLLDFKKNQDEWENRTVDSYLEGILAWIDDMDGYFENNNIKKPENISWNFPPMLYMQLGFMNSLKLKKYADY